MSRHRAPSGSSTMSSTHKNTNVHAKGAAVSFHAPETSFSHTSHMRDIVSHLLHPVDYYRRRRSFSWQGHPIPVKVALEPTYRLEPERRPNIKALEHIIDYELNSMLHDISYNSFEATNLSKVISDRLRSETKKLLSPNNRYKVISTVVISQNKRQAMQISSRCLWESEYDFEVTRLFENPTLTAVGTIYCVYTP